jgi:hypothetical protein
MSRIAPPPPRPVPWGGACCEPNVALNPVNVGLLGAQTVVLHADAIADFAEEFWLGWSDAFASDLRGRGIHYLIGVGVMISANELGALEVYL